MNRTSSVAVLVAWLLTPGTSAAAQQAPAPAPAPQPRPSAVAQPAPVPAVAPVLPIDELNARDTQRRLQELLRDYPPSLSRVLQLDPTLLNNQAYLAPYPGLAAFIAQHPDVIHHASFYLGNPDFGGGQED